jgi:uncharacterized protein DUF4216
LYNLVCGPSRVVGRYTTYVVNGFRFHTSDRSENRETQNSGVMVRGDDASDKEYYGVLRDIYQVRYPGENHVFVFKCSWFDVQNLGRGYKVDEHGLISVNKNRLLKTDDVYVLESQVEQVFYIEDEHNENWAFVIKAQPRDLYNMSSSDLDKEDIDVDAFQQVEVEAECSNIVHTDNFRVSSSLATNMFMDYKGEQVVQMVTQILEDDNFINDGEIEVFEESSEVEEEI